VHGRVRRRLGGQRGGQRAARGAGADHAARRRPQHAPAGLAPPRPARQPRPRACPVLRAVGPAQAWPPFARRAAQDGGHSVSQPAASHRAPCRVLGCALRGWSGLSVRARQPNLWTAVARPQRPATSGAPASCRCPHAPLAGVLHAAVAGRRRRAGARRAHCGRPRGGPAQYAEDALAQAARRCAAAPGRCEPRPRRAPSARGPGTQGARGALHVQMCATLRCALMWGADPLIHSYNGRWRLLPHSAQQSALGAARSTKTALAVLREMGRGSS